MGFADGMADSTPETTGDKLKIIENIFKSINHGVTQSYPGFHGV